MFEVQANHEQSDRALVLDHIQWTVIAKSGVTKRHPAGYHLGILGVKRLKGGVYAE